MLLGLHFLRRCWTIWEGFTFAPVVYTRAAAIRWKWRIRRSRWRRRSAERARRSPMRGLSHDIGKAADHEMEGGILVGCRVGSGAMKRVEGGHPRALGHQRRPPGRDALHLLSVSAAGRDQRRRPGARRETLEKHVRRLEELESLRWDSRRRSGSRDPGRTRDQGACRQPTARRRRVGQPGRAIAHMIQSRLTYPGEVKVTVLRESRSVEFAR